MATYAQEKRTRQGLLREIKKSHRDLDTQNEKLRRLLESKRRARTLLDNEDVADIVRYTDGLLEYLRVFQVNIGKLASYIGSS